MRVVINAQLDPQTSGGIAQVILGLAHGLAQLDERQDEYVFVCSEASAAWLRPFIARHLRIEVNGCVGKPHYGVRDSDGFWESYDPDVLHFPYQAYTRTQVPSVFNPHDLQHVHLPDLFTDQERARRDALYGEACHHATAVATASRFVHDDIIRHFNLPSHKVEVIPWGAPTEAYRRPSDGLIARTLRRYSISKPFAIYPAQIWPHKNHTRLLDALRQAIDDGCVELSLVCTGAFTQHVERVRQRIDEMNLHEHVRMVGWVDEETLMALYASARFMIVPTLFEAVSLPVLEAFANRLPVACSRVTSLPEQVGDAALLFDPMNVEQLADAIRTLATRDDLCDELSRRGAQRIAQATWRRTAESYARLYRSVGIVHTGDRADTHAQAGQPVEGLTA